MTDLSRVSGQSRTSRLAFVVASRQAGEIVRPALTLRIIALAVALTVFAQFQLPIAIALSLPAVAICMLRARTVPSFLQPRAAASSGPAAATPPTGTAIGGAGAARTATSHTTGTGTGTGTGRAGTTGTESENTAGTGTADFTDHERVGPSRPVAVRSATRRRRWIIASWGDLLSALLVTTVAAWGTDALPTSSRLIALSAAATLLSVVCARLCLDPRWYRPDPRPRRLARLLRTLAGPLGSTASLVLALPAPWGPGERTIVAVVSLLPMATVAMTQDQDLTVLSVVEMIRSEAQDGRQSVLDELHGTLSANLRLLEQASLELRTASPRLYELAVGANSRLRETLTLADPGVDSAAEPQTLGALVRTLAMAVGAGAEVIIGVQRLVDGDRDLVRLVLNDAVGVVLADGASSVSASIRLIGDSMVVSVEGGGPRERERLRRLGPLRRRLATAGGSISDEPAGSSDGRRALVARWPASAGTA